MRDLKTCQAEVFLRSENRIKARKKRRNRILMTCIPMALGLTVIVAALWPKASVSSGTPEQETYAQLSGFTAESATSSVAKIDIVSKNAVLSRVETVDILKITDFLDRCTAEKPECAPMVPQDAPPDPESGLEDTEDNDFVTGGRGEAPEATQAGNKHAASGGLMDSTDASLSADLTVILTDHNGSQTQYALRGNRLTNLTNNVTYVLTPAQVTEFKSLLGVSQP